MKPSVRKENYFIREIEAKRGIVYEVAGYTDRGKRVRKRLKTRELALGYIHRLEMADLRQPTRYHHQETLLTAEQVKEAETCFDRLPEGVSLSDAVDGFLKGYDPAIKSKSAEAAFVEFLTVKENENCRPLTLDNLRRRIGKFVADLGNPTLSEINEARAREFLDGFTPTNSNNYRRALNQFFDFCVARDYCSENLMQKIKAKHVDRADEVMILAASQAKRLLKAAHDLHDGDLLPFVALGMFAGLRPISELESLEWADIDLADREIHVKRTKNRNHVRYVEIHPALVDWLRLCIGKPIISTNHRRKFAALKQAIGFRGGLPGKRQAEIDELLAPWEADTLRHTYGSFLYAEKKDVGEVAAQMGNSPDIVMRHYRKAVKPADAKRFWNLTPETVLTDETAKLEVV